MLYTFGTAAGFHQAVHSSDTDMDAIITLENKGDLICSKPLAAVGVNMEDQRRNILILLDGGRGFSREMLIVVDSVDRKNLA